jgi:hypothetical protein
MTATLLSLALLALADEPMPKPEKERPKHSPIAPSLPYLTNEEEEKLDRVIDRFILFDTGRLPGAEGQQAARDFEKLGTEAIPALIRGLNRAAMIEHSCPTLVISRKLSRMLAASNDPELLEFARDTIGAGVERSSHARVLKDLRFACQLRKNDLARRASAGPKEPKAMTLVELSEAARKETGPRLKLVLTELEKRRGTEVVTGLAYAAANADTETKPLARDLLDSHLGRLPAIVVRQKLKDSDAEVRKAAARVVAAKQPGLGGDLIDLVADAVPEVREAARQALMKLSKGEDFGPADTAGAAEIEAAQKKWRAWWTSQRRSP